jgi:hypothetical protein
MMSRCRYEAAARGQHGTKWTEWAYRSGTEWGGAEVTLEGLNGSTSGWGVTAAAGNAGLRSEDVVRVVLRRTGGSKVLFDGVVSRLDGRVLRRGGAEDEARESDLVVVRRVLHRIRGAEGVEEVERELGGMSVEDIGKLEGLL